MSIATLTLPLLKKFIERYFKLKPKKAVDYHDRMRILDKILEEQGIIYHASIKFHGVEYSYYHIGTCIFFIRDIIPGKQIP